MASAQGRGGFRRKFAFNMMLSPLRASLAPAIAMSPMAAVSPAAKRVQQHAETMLLPIVETVVQRFGGARELHQFRGARLQAFRTRLQSIDRIMLSVMVLGLFTPLRDTRGAGFCLLADGGFERRPVLFLSLGKFQAGLQWRP